MVFVLILALLLRLILLSQSFWLDESIQALAVMGQKGPLLSYALADFHPPLYHFFLAGWASLFGYSEVALRMPSVILGVISVYLLMKMVADVSSGRAALIAGVLLATNPLHIYYSQEARMYMLASFLVLGSYYLFIRLLQDSGKHNLLLTAFYFLLTTAALWTDYITWVAIGLQLIYLLIKRRWDIVLTCLLPFLTLIFWLPSLLGQLSIGLSTKANSPEWGSVVGGANVKTLLLTWIKFSIGRIGFYNRYLYAAVLMLVALSQLPALIRIKKTRSIFWIWLLGTVAVTFLVALIVPVYSYFRVLLVLPAFMAVLAIGYSTYPRWPIILSGTTVLNLIFLVIFWTTPRFHRENWRSLVGYLNGAENSQSATALPSLAQNAPLQYYRLTTPMFEPKEGVDQAGNTVYYLNYAEDLFDVRRVGRSNLSSAGYDISEERIFDNLHLIVYRKP